MLMNFLLMSPILTTSASKFLVLDSFSFIGIIISAKLLLKSTNSILNI